MLGGVLLHQVVAALPVELERDAAFCRYRRLPGRAASRRPPFFSRPTTRLPAQLAAVGRLAAAAGEEDGFRDLGVKRRRRAGRAVAGGERQHLDRPRVGLFFVAFHAPRISR